MGPLNPRRRSGPSQGLPKALKKSVDIAVLFRLNLFDNSNCTYKHIPAEKLRFPLK